MTKTTTVTFVFVGDSLPAYARASLSLAVDSSGLDVTLLCSDGIARTLKDRKFTVVALNDFYDPVTFESASKNVLYPGDFRNGLWHRSMERLFVLQQYVEATARDSVYHAELDQLLFRNDLLLAHLDALPPQGVYLPFHSSERALASVLYCNRAEALDSLVDAAANGPPFKSEMHLLANWAEHYPELASALPTLVNVVAPENAPRIPRIATLPVETLGGVVDAAQVGQWLGGVDPRNVPLTKTPQTKFVDPLEPGLLSREDLEGVTFTYDHNQRELTCRSDNGTNTRIYNIHLHSKVHTWIAKSEDALPRLIDLGNQPTGQSIPGTRRVQVTSRTRESAAKLRSDPRRGLVIASQRANRALRRRPSSEPFISGDGFRALADHVWERGNEVLRAEALARGDIVFCESDLLEQFAEHVLTEATQPIVLLAGNSDRNFDTDPIPQAMERLGLSIFAQNLRAPLDGYRPLPIGLENAWLANHGNSRRFARNRQRPIPRQSRILSAFSPVTNPSVRVPAAQTLGLMDTVDEPGALSPRAHRQSLRSHMFVASPPGNGEDTHRTWEAMYLGCVPIVLDSVLTQELDRLGLPIWVVESYDDVEKFTEPMLGEKYESLKRRFCAEALWLSYWASEVREVQRAILAGL